MSGDPEGAAAAREQYLRASSTHVVIIFRERVSRTTVVCFVAYELQEDNAVAFVLELHVKKEFQKLYFGTELLAELKCRARVEGAHIAQLAILIENSGNPRL